MNELTPRQQRVLNFIQDFIEETGMPPTRAEIARDLGFKSANAAESTSGHWSARALFH